jgi:hypothetical protein
LGRFQVQKPIVSDWESLRREELLMLAVGMVVLGLVTFAALLAFVELCNRV